MNDIHRLVLSVMPLLIAACATSNQVISRGDAQLLQGKGVDIVVDEVGTLASNLDGAMLFGAIGQAVKGGSIQSSLQLADPSAVVASKLRIFLSSKYGTTAANNEYRVHLKTTYWWLGKPIGADTDNIVAAAIIELKATDQAGRVIASATFNGMGDQKRFPIRKSDLGNSALVQSAFNDAAEQAATRFIQVLTGT